MWQDLANSLRYCILGNNIEDEGGCSLAESLKQNTTLVKLNFGCKSNLDRLLIEIMSISSLQSMHDYFYSVNKTGREGACGLAEVLKLNTTLTELNIKGTSTIICRYVIRFS